METLKILNHKDNLYQLLIISSKGGKILPTSLYSCLDCTDTISNSQDIFGKGI